MKKTVCMVALGLMVGLCAYAAGDVPQADVFLGYSFMRYNSAQSVPAFTANGGLGTFGWNFNKYIGLEGELGGYHNGNINNHEFDTTTFSYLFGPRVSINRSRTLIPYVHALWGGQNAHTSICCLAISNGVTTVVSTGSRASRDQNGFAQAYGGGLDIKLSKSIILRPIQLDYLMTRFQAVDFSTFTGPSTNRNQHNLRYAAGVAFNIGGAR
jgi:opacity protein-like surface antigen